MNYSAILKKALPHLIAIIVFLVVAVVYCKPVLEGKIVNQSDVVQQTQMARQATDYKAKYGRYPLWIENAFSGMPAYTVAIDGLNPKNPAVIVVGFLSDLLMLHLPQPINFFFLGCICFYILMMVLRVDPWIAALASLAYAYSSYDPIIIGTGHVTKMWAISLAPGVLASYLMLFQRKYWWGTALLAFFFFDQILTQHLQIVYYTVICMGLITIFLITDAAKNGKLKHTVYALGLAALAMGIGFGTSIGATLPDAEYAKETMRGGRTELSAVNKQESKNGLSYDYAFMWSYGIGETLTLAVPDAAGGGDLNAPEIGDNSKFADRAVQDFNIPEQSALNIANGLAYWGPQPSTSGPVYLGAVICFLAIFGLFLLKGPMKWGLLTMIVLGIIMAWGDHLPAINYFIFDHLPFYNKFRSPSTALFMPQLAAPILVGLVLQQLNTGNLDAAVLWNKFKRTMIVSGVLIVIMIGYYVTASFKADGKYGPGRESGVRQEFVQLGTQQLQHLGTQPPDAIQAQAIAATNTVFRGLEEDRKSLYGGDMIRSIILIALTAGLIGLFLKGKIKKPVILWVALLLLSSYDLLAVDARYLKTESYIDPADNDAKMAPTPADQQIMADPDKNFRVYDGTDRSLTSSARANNFHNSLGGYSPAKLGLYEDILQNQLAKGNMHVFDMLNTRYFIEPDQKTGQLMAERNPNAFGPCWLVKSIDFVKDGDAEMQALDSVNVRDTVIIQQKYQPEIPFPPVFDTSASIVLIDNRLDTIDYRFSAKTNQFAVFSEIYYSKGWDAYIDGKKADYLRVDYLLRGLPIPAGDHRIQFRFEPSSYKLGSTITSLFCFAIIVLIVLACIKRPVIPWQKGKSSAKSVA